jgi:hypothetical protein
MLPDSKRNMNSKIDDRLHDLPQSVRYVKNGAGGKWWGTAKTRGQLPLWMVVRSPRDARSS